MKKLIFVFILLVSFSCGKNNTTGNVPAAAGTTTASTSTLSTAMQNNPIAQQLFQQIMNYSYSNTSSSTSGYCYYVNINGTVTQNCNNSINNGTNNVVAPNYDAKKVELINLINQSINVRILFSPIRYRNVYVLDQANGSYYVIDFYLPFLSNPFGPY